MSETSKRWFQLRWLDVAGLLGLFMLVPQVVDRFTSGQASDPTLAGFGTMLILAASGGSRAVDALAKRWGGSK